MNRLVAMLSVLSACVHCCLKRGSYMQHNVLYAGGSICTKNLLTVNISLAEQVLVRVKGFENLPVRGKAIMYLFSHLKTRHNTYQLKTHIG